LLDRLPERVAGRLWRSGFANAPERPVDRGEVNAGSVAVHGGEFEDVSQLPRIAGPRVRLQAIERLRLETAFADCGLHLLEEVLRETPDIIRTNAEWRNLDD